MKLIRAHRFFLHFSLFVFYANFSMKLTVAENNLHNRIKALVATERKTLAEIIENLQRVYDTRLFAKMGYSSLIKYLIKECGYSEGAAYRRYQALKLTKEIPEAKDK